MLESVGRRQVRASSIVELSDEQMHLRQPVVTLFEFLLRLCVIAAAGKFFPHLVECGDGLLHRFRVAIDRFCHLDMNLPNPEGGIGSEHVIPMQF